MKRIFKKLFILLQNIQMTTTNSYNMVDTVDTNKKVTLKWAMITFALFAALFGKNVTWVAQNTQKTKENLKEIIISTPTQKENDSTIMYNDAKWLENWEEIGITSEEIQEYLENHKEEIVQTINKEKLDDKSKEVVYEELMNNKKIQFVIEKMVNDQDTRKAVLEWDSVQIQMELQKELEVEFETHRFLKTIWSLEVFLFIINIIIGIIRGIVRTSHWKTFFRRKEYKSRLDD